MRGYCQHCKAPLEHEQEQYCSTACAEAEDRAGRAEGWRSKVANALTDEELAAMRAATGGPEPKPAAERGEPFGWAIVDTLGRCRTAFVHSQYDVAGETVAMRQAGGEPTEIPLCRSSDLAALAVALESIAAAQTERPEHHGWAYGRWEMGEIAREALARHAPGREEVR